jgi:hypothetical protein
MSCCVLTLHHPGDLEAEDVVGGVLDQLDHARDDGADDVESGLRWQRDAVAVEVVDGREVRKPQLLLDQQRPQHREQRVHPRAQRRRPEGELLHLREPLVAWHVVVPFPPLRPRVLLGPGAAGAAPAWVGVLVAAAEHGAVVGGVPVGVAEVVVHVVVVDALEGPALAVPVAAQRLELLLPQLLQALWRLRRQERLHANTGSKTAVIVL